MEITQIAPLPTPNQTQNSDGQYQIPSHHVNQLEMINPNEDVSRNVERPRFNIGALTFMGMVFTYMNVSIGTGIYSSPGPLYESLFVGWSAILVWMLSGLIIVCGAITYGLATIGKRGFISELEFLDETMGPLAAFHNAFVSCVTRQAAVSAVVLSFSEHLLPLVFGLDRERGMVWEAVGITILIMFILTLLSSIRFTISDSMQLVFFIVRLAIIFLVIVGGVGLLIINRTNIFEKLDPFEQLHMSNVDGAFSDRKLQIAQAFQLALWCHNGWFNIGQVLDGVTKNSKVICAVAGVSGFLSSLLFALVMITYFVVLDPVDIKGLSVVADYAEALTGKPGRIIILVMVYFVSCGATFVAIRANAWAQIQASTSSYFHPLLARRYTKYQFEIAPLLLNFIISALLIVVFERDFVSLVTFLITTSFITSSITAYAVIKFLKCNYKGIHSWGPYSIAPILFILFTVSMLAVCISENTAIGMVSLGIHFISLLAWRAAFRYQYIRMTQRQLTTTPQTGNTIEISAS